MACTLEMRMQLEAEIADLKRKLSEANEKLEEQEGWIHSCPQCGMKCKECECMENLLIASRDREAALRRALVVSVECADSHYAHFDREGNAGATCPACIARREANDIARAALRKTT